MKGYVLNYLTYKNDKNAESYFANSVIADNKAIKDPEKQEAWKQEKRLKMIEDAHKQAVTGQIIGYCLASVTGDADYCKVMTDEKTLLAFHLNDAISKTEGNIWMKGAKNHSLPYLIRRYIACNVPVPAFMRPACSWNTSSRKVEDTNLFIGSYSSSCDEAMSSVNDDYFLVTGDLVNLTTDVKLACEMLKKGDETARKEIESHIRMQALKTAMYVNQAIECAGGL